MRWSGPDTEWWFPVALDSASLGEMSGSVFAGTAVEFAAVPVRTVAELADNLFRP